MSDEGSRESALLPPDPSPGGPRCAIVLAGRRSADDPLSKAAGAVHRALVDIDGEPMLLRVVERLNAWPTIERILINIDEPALLLDLPDLTVLRKKGLVEIMKSTDSPSRSVLESLNWADLGNGPVLVTTADHALLDDHMLDVFFRESARVDADLTFGFVSRATIEERFPEAKRTYLRFRDGAFSGANLFLFRTPNAERAAAFWQRVESERKRPWRIARAFGFGTLLLFLARRLDLDAALMRVSNVIGARVQAIRLPIAEAAVDVDKLEDLELVRRILAERRSV
jgi:GTP:adenosylcobinamide-phosphate guanylyltransferase